MKSIAILFAGIGVLACGVVQSWRGDGWAEQWAIAKPWTLAASGILIVGLIWNHREHTRRR